MAEFILPPALSFAVTAWIIRSMLRSGTAGPLDQPNHRSLHAVAVPRSGGVGMLLGLVPAVVWVLPSLPVIAGALLLAVVSWWDDRRSLPVWVRLASHGVVAALVIVAIIGSRWPVGIAVVLVVATVWSTNLYNFMDGANGLAGGMAVAGFGAYAFAAFQSGRPELGVFSASIAAAAAGFLIFNFDPARIFMGDVGSIPLGFLAASLGVLGTVQEAWPAWFPVLAFSPFIVDATVTLMRRALRGERVWEAHRDHLYQRLVQSGWSHRRLALTAYPLMLAAGASACLLARQPQSMQEIGLLAWLAIYAFVIFRCWNLTGEKLPNEPGQHVD